MNLSEIGIIGESPILINGEKILFEIALERYNII